MMALSKNFIMAIPWSEESPEGAFLEPHLEPIVFVGKQLGQRHCITVSKGKAIGKEQTGRVQERPHSAAVEGEEWYGQSKTGHW